MKEDRGKDVLNERRERRREGKVMREEAEDH